MIRQFLLVLIILTSFIGQGQDPANSWYPDGSALVTVQNGNIVRLDPKTGEPSVIVSKSLYTPPGSSALNVESFSFSPDRTKMLLFTNSKKVWRLNTKGDYWLVDIPNKKLRKLGFRLKPHTLMFAKFSPDSKQIAYVSENNIYTEDVAVGVQRKLTSDGTDKLINGTFDWVYEEEFGCRDGFRWSPDSKRIAYWQVDARKVKNYFMINNIDSNYSLPIPIEYPKVGEDPSPVRIGVVNITGGSTQWMKLDGSAKDNYIPKMDWSENNGLFIQQLNRRQNESKLIMANATTGVANTFWAENDAAWVDVWGNNATTGINETHWLKRGEEFLWVSEKNGWRHIYKISKDGRNITDLTPGNFDVLKLEGYNEGDNAIYFSASPQSAKDLYLFKASINPTGKNDLVLLTDQKTAGWNTYSVSPSGKLAYRTFTNFNTPAVSEMVSLPDHKPLDNNLSIARKMQQDPSVQVEYMEIVTEDNIKIDAWVRKPANMQAGKKYPIVFYVYGEPWGSTVTNKYGEHTSFLYRGDMVNDGYIQASIDNRGTPSLKGAGWRKAIYKNIGRLNIRDMAQAAQKILEQPYVDKDRVAVWGWSGGGSSTLNLMFQYPEIFKTGIAIAAVANQLYYDNVYQERYMGSPMESTEPYIQGSPATHAKGLKGNLLLIHGTGDDNVHYSNAEYLVNELVKNGKQFQFMAYPNRSHSLAEGEGTMQHLSALFTNFLRANCPPGPR